jgi:hypothetical protein
MQQVATAEDEVKRNALLVVEDLVETMNDVE